MVLSFTHIIKRTLHILIPYTESSSGCNPLAKCNPDNDSIYGIEMYRFLLQYY